MLMIITILIISALIYVLAITWNVKLDDSKLINLDRTVTFYDINGNVMTEETEKNSVTNIENIPKHVVNAFIAIEDKRFYKHNGVDVRSLFRALFNNIKSFSFKEGASTISQQLIKNTHLSGEKTLNRKIIEMKLARQLEKKYSKEEIMEMYLNTIYFGENCFGITDASEHYFSKSPSELDVNESAMLAGIVKAPSYYSPFINYDKCNERKNVVLKEMFSQGYISQAEYESLKATEIKLTPYIKNNFDYIYLAEKEFTTYMENARFLAKKFNVYTFCDPEKQKILSNTVSECGFEGDKSSILIDKNSNVLAYSSTCGEIYRQLGSTIKPLLVYAPAIETNTVNSCTIIKDEKANFNGYTPSNFNNKYYGNVSVKASLAKSLNVCAVKILNYTGIEKSLEYLNKTDIKLTENDKGLSLALGANENGATLSQIVSAYSVFNNNGLFNSARCIYKIEDENGNIIYNNKNKNTKIFAEDTVEILNDMMRYTVTDGTAKKLSFTDLNLYAKTGTVGTENGNTDAYTISYNKDFTLGFWLGNKDNSLFDNNITGGALPAQLSASIWENVYLGKTPPTLIPSNNVSDVYLDLISYENSKIEIAEEIAPERYKERFLFKNSNLPKDLSTRFSSPTVDEINYSVNNNCFCIELCLAEYYDYKVYKEVDGKKICIFDSTHSTTKDVFVDDKLIENKTYVYSIVPYYNNGKTIYYGKEIILDKIKAPKLNLGADWWIDEFD